MLRIIEDAEEYGEIRFGCLEAETSVQFGDPDPVQHDDGAVGGELELVGVQVPAETGGIHAGAGNTRRDLLRLERQLGLDVLEPAGIAAFLGGGVGIFVVQLLILRCGDRGGAEGIKGQATGEAGLYCFQ